MKFILTQVVSAVLLQSHGSYAVDEPNLRGFARARQSVVHGPEIVATTTIEESSRSDEETSSDLLPLPSNASFEGSVAQKRQERRDRHRHETNLYRPRSEGGWEREREQSLSPGKRDIDSSEVEREDAETLDYYMDTFKSPDDSDDASDHNYYYYYYDYPSLVDDGEYSHYYYYDDNPYADSAERVYAKQEEASRLSPKSREFRKELKEDSVDVPEFIPYEVEINFKKHAPLRRQDQRDRRRRKSNLCHPRRGEESGRARKRVQDSSRGTRDIDPQDRDAQRRDDCHGRGCQEESPEEGKNLMPESFGKPEDADGLDYLYDNDDYPTAESSDESQDASSLKYWYDYDDYPISHAAED
ncbi:hypothetical protein ACHAXS_001004 [Conticribra weissflogii]